MLLPVAAVSGIADCSLVTGMTRSRAWIVVLGLLLGGIVAMNVLGLGLSASSSSVEAKIDGLQRENGVLQTRSAKTLSTEEIQSQAATLGLALPAPDAIHYLDAHRSDAAKAARRLAQGLITVGDPPLPSSEADVTSTDPGAVAPAASPVEGAVPTAPVPPEAAVAPAAATPPAIDPAAASTDPATGAVAAP